jgi:hypothetical protein
MGGIGISMGSQESKVSASSSLAALPDKVIEQIAAQLGIVKPESISKARESLVAEKLDLPDGAEVTLTRRSTGDSLTLTKLGGGATYRLKLKDKTVDVTP